MAYCIRYIFEHEPPPALSRLAENIHTLDAAYRLDERDGTAELRCDDAVIGRATLEPVDDPSTNPVIETLLAELDALAEEDEELDTDAADHRLWNATGVLTVEVVWDGDAHRESLEKLNPVWGMLLGTYPGLLYAEGEAYYDADGVLLELP